MGGKQNEEEVESQVCLLMVCEVGLAVWPTSHPSVPIVSHPSVFFLPAEAKNLYHRLGCLP